MPKEPIPEVFEGFPVVTAERMRTIDHLAAEKFGLTTLILMENAGRAVAEATAGFMKEKLGRDLAGTPVVVCCGRGANGGDGLVAARHMSEKGAKVSVFLCPPRKDSEYPDYFRANLERAKAAGVEVMEAGPESGLAAALSEAAVALDALLGTGSAGKPAGAIHHMIQEINRSKKPVLAVDIPSGLQPDTGYHSGVFITAAVTLTLGLPKQGLLTPHAKRNVGELKVLDIGYPRGLYEGKS